ncbi:hypothetical protein AAKU67_004357 [Oxalobacteraceae bacterium GrIS 2.11]
MARPTKSNEEKLCKSVAFRLTELDFNIYQKKFMASGLKQSEFFRRHVLTNSTTIAAPSRTAARAVLLLSKVSNNINQLAHRANIDNRSGKLNDIVFQQILSQLTLLNDYVQVMVDEARK